MKSALAANLRRIRKQKNLSQRELGRKAHTTAVAGYEAGSRTRASHDILERLARALDVEVDDLVRRPRRAVR